MSGNLRTDLIALTVIAAVCLGLVGSCSKERGLEPKSIAQRLYVGTWAPNSRVYVFDATSDSLLDSTAASDHDMNALVASDGDYLLRYAGGSVCPEIWDTKTLAFVAAVPGCTGIPVPAARDRLLLAVKVRSIDYIEYPSLSVQGTDSLLPDSGQYASPQAIDEEHGILFLRVDFGVGHIERSEVLGWDYLNRHQAGWWDFRTELGKEWVIIYSLCVDGPGNALYAIVNHPSGSSVLRFELATRRVTWSMPISDPFARVTVSPSREELWRYHHAPSRIDGASASYVYIHNAATGQVGDSIALPRWAPDLPGSNSIQDIAFLLDGTRAYLAAGDIFHRAGPVFVVDVGTHKVIDSLLTGGKYYPYTVDVAKSP